MSLQQFEGEDLESLRERVQTELGSSARIVRAGKVRRGGICGFFTREAYQLEVDAPPVHAEPVPSPVLLDDVAGAVADVVHVDFSRHLDLAVAAAGAGGGYDRRTVHAAVPAPILPAAVAAEESPVAVVAEESPVAVAAEESPVAVVAEESPVAVAAQAAAGPSPAGTADPTVVVVAIGAAPAVDVEAERLSSRISASLAASPGGAVAEILRVRLDNDSEDAAFERVAGRSAVRRLEEVPTVVAIDVGRWGGDLASAARLVRALRADEVVAVVPAAAKPEDVAAWADRIGGVAALAVVDTAATTTPGTALQIGIPVVSIDGQAAGPAELSTLAGRDRPAPAGTGPSGAGGESLDNAAG